ncbi:hypothetical protein D3C77_355590 [compost metagenome]
MGGDAAGRGLSAPHGGEQSCGRGRDGGGRRGGDGQSATPSGAIGVACDHPGPQGVGQAQRGHCRRDPDEPAAELRRGGDAPGAGCGLGPGRIELGLRNGLEPARPRPVLDPGPGQRPSHGRLRLPGGVRGRFGPAFGGRAAGRRSARRRLGAVRGGRGRRGGQCHPAPQLRRTRDTVSGVGGQRRRRGPDPLPSRGPQLDGRRGLPLGGIPARQRPEQPGPHLYR